MIPPESAFNSKNSAICNKMLVILDAMADDAESIVQIRENLEYYRQHLSTEGIVALLKLMISDELIRGYFNDTDMFEDSWFELTSKGRNYLNDNIDLVE